MVEDTSSAERFVLLRDFEHSYKQFSLKEQGKLQEIIERFRGPMDKAIKDNVDDLNAFSLQDIRSLVKEEVVSGNYVVTIDGGTYFSNHDFSFEMTRACYKLEHAINGPYFRLPRQGGRLDIQQSLRLRDDYLENGHGQSIVLCDDGIGTGKTIKHIMNRLDQVNRDVDRIAVLLNPNNHTHLNGVSVNTLLEVETPFIWLSERDLFWGLPRGGLSLTKQEELLPIYGIPYTLDNEMVMARIGLKEEPTKRFRTACLNVNKHFWEYMEDIHNRDLRFKDCPRLSFFGAKLNIEQMRIVEFIERINRPDFDRHEFL